jgi:hypothetical protein
MMSVIMLCYHNLVHYAECQGVLKMLVGKNTLAYYGSDVTKVL